MSGSRERTDRFAIAQTRQRLVGNFSVQKSGKTSNDLSEILGSAFRRDKAAAAANGPFAGANLIYKAECREMPLYKGQNRVFSRAPFW